MRKISITLLILGIIFSLQALSFSENWNSGSFATNNWTFSPEQGSWDIMDMGECVARFGGFPPITDYDFSLVSPQLDATESDSVFIEIETKGSLMMSPCQAELDIELAINDGEWQLLDSVVPAEGNMMDPPELFAFQLPEAAGNNFKLRFRSHGASSDGLMFYDVYRVLAHDENYVEPAIISGIVTDSDANPIHNALVQAGNNLQYSDWGGNYSLAVDTVTDTVLRVTSIGYQPYEQNIAELSPGDNQQIDIALQEANGYLEPINLTSEINYSININCNLSWDSPMQYIEYLHDSGIPEGEHAPMMPTGDEYMASKYTLEQNENLRYLKVLVKANTAQTMELAFFGDDNGQPDSEPITDPVEYWFEPNMPNVFEWIYIPLDNVDLAEETIIYPAIRYNMSNTFLLGIATPESETSNTWSTIDAGQSWNAMNSQEAFIRLLVENEEYERDLIAYRVYQNNQLVAELTESYAGIPQYYDLVLENQNQQNFYVTAVYETEESAKSNITSIIPNAYDFRLMMMNDQQSYYINVLSRVYHPVEEIELLEIYRNSELISTIDEFNSNDNNPNYSFQTYEDYAILSDVEYDYHIEIHLINGETIVSENKQITPLLPATQFCAEGTENGVELSWQPPQTERELLGYNLLRNGEIIAEGITESSYTDSQVEFGQLYEYFLVTVYDSYEAWGQNIQVVAGPPILPQPINLDGENYNEMLYLTWENPDARQQVVQHDMNNIAAGFTEADYSASVKFHPWDFYFLENSEITGLYFYPTSAASYLVQVLIPDVFNPGEEFMILEETVDVSEANSWQKVNFNQFISNESEYRIEITCQDGAELAYDKSASPQEEANILIIDQEETDLLAHSDISGNWKIRLSVEKMETINPVRDLYPELLSYQIFHDEIMVEEINFIDSGIELEYPLDGIHQYQVLAVYDEGESELSEPFELSLTSIEDDVAELKQVELLQNMPNPFNPTTTFSFALPQAANVELTVYNARGQVVKNLIEERFAAGTHTTIWNGKNQQQQQVSSGIYFYRLKVDGKMIDSKKCMMLK